MEEVESSPTVAVALDKLVTYGLLDSVQASSIDQELKKMRQNGTKETYSAVILRQLPSGKGYGDVAGAIATVQVRVDAEERCVLVSVWGIFMSRGSQLKDGNCH